MITADGMIAEKIDAETAENSPSIEGVILQKPKVGEYAVAAELPGEDATIAAAADRLAVAVKILEQLETWELFSPATRLDVSDLFGLRLYCGPDYRVELGDGTDMDAKIMTVKYTLPQLDGRGGVLKLTYNETEQMWEVIYQPWSQG